MRRAFCALLIAGLTFSIASCGSDSDDDDKVDTDFLKVTQSVLPVIGNASSAKLLLAKADDTFAVWGNPKFELLGMLGDPTLQSNKTSYKADDWGNLNIYNVIKTPANFVRDNSDDCANEVDRIVEPTFNIGSDKIKFECLKNFKNEKSADGSSTFTAGLAWDVDDQVTYAMGTWSSVNPVYDSFLFRGVHEENTGKVVVDYVGYTSYLPADAPDYKEAKNLGRYIPRMFVEGNEKTHDFTFKFTKWSPASVKEGDTVKDGLFLQAVGKGVSRGSGKHFLIKMNYDIATSDWSETVDSYWCIKADSNIDELKALTGTTYENVSKNCEAYKEAVKNMEAFAKKDLPSAKFATTFN